MFQDPQPPVIHHRNSCGKIVMTYGKIVMTYGNIVMTYGKIVMRSKIRKPDL